MKRIALVMILGALHAAPAAASPRALTGPSP